MTSNIILAPSLMLVYYNKKCKYRLSMRKLYGSASDEDDLDDEDDSYSDE